jgi:hypothetical protein
VDVMNTSKATAPPEEPTIEYTVVEDEFDILSEVFDEIFEHIEKEIKQ